ncbi:MAG: arginase family protein [Gaiellales bacterium]
MISPIVVPWASQHYAPGMQEGPDAVLAALGSPAAARVGVATLDTALAGTADAAELACGLPLALLGECTLVPGFVAGALRRSPDASLIWIDAHGDLNTPGSSATGYVGGMPFAVIVGWWGHEQRVACSFGGLAEERCALVGARDLDPGEASMLAGSRIVSAQGVAEAIAALPADAPLVVHLDGDVLDPTVAPGVDVPAPDGWSVERLRDEIAAIAATGRLAAISLCCGNPRRDEDGRSARAYLDGLAPVLEG